MSLTISLQFPTGRYAAASWSDRDSPEWPPHPARFCLGLLDALYRADNPQDERAALLWLCSLPAPVVVIPHAARIHKDVIRGVFVPQNPSEAKTGIKHPRKERSFPVVFVEADTPTVFFHWNDTDRPDDMYEPLARLLGRLPRFGHSSSLVIAALCDGVDSDEDQLQKFIPVGAGNLVLTPELQLRVPWAGLIESAETSYAKDERAVEMSALIADAEKKAKPTKTLKPTASPRGRHDPRHHWCGYMASSMDKCVSTPWSRDVLLLRIENGCRLGLTSTWQISETLHKTLLDRWSRDPENGPVPSWISGHADGNRGQATAPAGHCHLAIFPLPHVGRKHAAGHLLGIGLALPRPEEIGLSRAEFLGAWNQVQAALFGESGTLELVASDKSWSVLLTPVASPSPPYALRPSRWTRPSTLWQSVTPVILDRHPKPHFRKDPTAWQASCETILRNACERIGLPSPVKVEPCFVSSLDGVPQSSAFVAPEQRAGRPKRFHLHARIEFAEKVEGPLLLGAGRFRGYGLFVPVSEPTSTQENDE